MVAWDGDDLAVFVGGWGAEWVSCALHDQGGDGKVVEFGEDGSVRVWFRLGVGVGGGRRGR